MHDLPGIQARGCGTLSRNVKCCGKWGEIEALRNKDSISMRK